MPYHHYTTSHYTTPCLTCTLEQGVFWRQVLDLSRQWCPHTELCKTRATWKQWTRKICFESEKDLTRNRWGTWGRCWWRNKRNYISIWAKSFKCSYIYKFPQYGRMEEIIAKEIKGRRSLMQPQFEENKLAKARKMRKPPGTLGLKKFVPGKIWVENVWTQNTCILSY